MTEMLEVAGRDTGCTSVQFADIAIHVAFSVPRRTKIS
jgi:hypothetical protein